MLQMLVVVPGRVKRCLHKALWRISIRDAKHACPPYALPQGGRPCHLADTSPLMRAAYDRHARARSRIQGSSTHADRYGSGAGQRDDPGTLENARHEGGARRYWLTNGPDRGTAGWPRQSPYARSG